MSARSLCHHRQIGPKDDMAGPCPFSFIFTYNFGALGRGSVTWHCPIADASDEKGEKAVEVPGKYLGGHISYVCWST